MITLYTMTTVRMLLLYAVAFQSGGGFIVLGYSGIENGPVSRDVHLSRSIWRSVWTTRALFQCCNIVADVIIIYRCYLVWGKKKWIMVLFAIVCLGTMGSIYLQFARSYDTAKGFFILYLVTTLFINLIIVLLTAGRIWWIGRKARALLARSILRRYDTSITILLESGILYPTFLLIAVILFITDAPFVAYAPFNAILFQVVAIAPTLIIVRVGLGLSTDDVESSVGHFRAAENVQHRDLTGSERDKVLDIRRMPSHNSVDAES